MQDRVERAIQALEAQGLADPARIGMVGFSRLGFHVNYFITHSRFVPAAAMILDSTSQGYFEHVMSNFSLSIRDDDDRGPMFGAHMRGGTFWEQRDRWLQTAPGFNYDVVDTPALYTYNAHRFAVVEVQEVRAAYQMNDREAYFQIYPQGGHQLQRPRQRQASLQTTLDWFGFWLLGQENGDADAAQNRAWRRLRANRDARWAAARAASHPFGPGWRALTPQAARQAADSPEATTPSED